MAANPVGKPPGAPKTHRPNARAKINVPRTSRRGAGPHPATNTDDLLTGTGILKWLESIRAVEAEGSDATALAADIIARGVRKSSKIPWGLNRIVVARRMRKAINHMAALQLEQARTASAVASIYRGFFGDPSTLKAASRQGLDPTR
jgi:hypothetical protein